MRSLYWKLFTSFWLATICIIFTTAWITGQMIVVSEKPISSLMQIPWTSLAIRLALAVFISGLICYLLSRYLTQPLRSLGMAAKSIATGKLDTRVGHLKGHKKDEIAELSHDFDLMAEKLETLVRSKERLLQDISHELRSPLARLNIAIELGRNKTHHLADAEFNRMELESARLNALIGEILNFARMEQSSMQLNLSKVYLPDLLAEIIKDANYEFNKNSVQIIANTIASCYLLVDKQLIYRAIENVIRNAAHYSTKNQQVLISTQLSANKKKIYIDIVDNGPGVPSEQLTNIFNPFYRIDNSPPQKTGGFGLGLTIASKAIALHDGEISAKNNKEGGLSIRIILPIHL